VKPNFQACGQNWRLAIELAACSILEAEMTVVKVIGSPKLTASRCWLWRCQHHSKSRQICNSQGFAASV
jgi:hypothetical protein